MLVLLLSHTIVETKLVAAASPVLHTLAPTGKILGPTETLFESKPITPQVIKFIVRLAAPWAEN